MPAPVQETAVRDVVGITHEITGTMEGYDQPKRQRYAMLYWWVAGEKELPARPPSMPWHEILPPTKRWASE